MIVFFESRIATIYYYISYSQLPDVMDA